ncbi:MAG: hypothetical protein MK074_05625 [Phycisphaerales bacterium]|nr:hypothetical protein [Phycisphaerales bacterium]
MLNRACCALIGATTMLSMSTAAVASGACVLEERWDNGSGLPWSPWTNSSALSGSVNSSQNQLQFDVGWITNLSHVATAGVETSGWVLDLTSNFVFTFEWSNTATNTHTSAVFLSLVLKNAAEGASVTPVDGAVYSMVCYGNSAVPLYQRQWKQLDGGVVVGQHAVNQGVHYSNVPTTIAYDAASDQLTMDGVTFTQFRQRTGDTVELTFTSSAYILYSGGIVSDQAATALNVEQLCFTTGSFSGVLTGACCMDDTCVQGFQEHCAGVFQGGGTTCDMLGACYDEDCPGDFTMDGVVDADDLTVVLSNWSQACTPCSGNATTAGIAGVRDLLSMLQNWGTCG